MRDMTHHKIHDVVHIRHSPIVHERASAELAAAWPFINFSLAVFQTLRVLEIRHELQKAAHDYDSDRNIQTVHSST